MVLVESQKSVSQPRFSLTNERSFIREHLGWETLYLLSTYTISRNLNMFIAPKAHFENLSMVARKISYKPVGI